jgi:hypothetical protein
LDDKAAAIDGGDHGKVGSATLALKHQRCVYPGNRGYCIAKALPRSTRAFFLNSILFPQNMDQPGWDG